MSWNCDTRDLGRVHSIMDKGGERDWKCSIL